MTRGSEEAHDAPSRALVIRVRLHEPRFHGAPDWPPAPARLLQALVAGAAARLAEPEVHAAFRWLEALPAPVIGAPRAILASEVTIYVPDNDLDTAGGNPASVASMRSPKRARPRLLEADVPIVYVWRFDGASRNAEVIAEIATELYQLGRGVDMAYASAEVTDAASLGELWEHHRGVVHSPSGTSSGGLSCPVPGTLDSLERRHAAQAERFRVEGEGRGAATIFVQPPKPLLKEIGYDCPSAQLVFELRSALEIDRFEPARLTHAAQIVTAWRDAAVARLTTALDSDAEVDAALVGRRPGGTSPIPKEQRIRIIPLPSIGHERTDPSIRRLLVEIPQAGPLPVEDVRWAFSALSCDATVLLESPDRTMADRYLAHARRWETITPAALPAGRRRIDPGRRADDSKGAAERTAEERAAHTAVREAARHAGIVSRITRIDVQREPWQSKGARAESFAAGPRFTKDRLWHVRIELERDIAGPITLGDGRFLGLGVMMPVSAAAPRRASTTVERASTRRPPAIFVWSIQSGLEPDADPLQAAAHLRRAVMSRGQAAAGSRPLAAKISGHRRDGSPVLHHRHLYYVADLGRSRLLVVDPEPHVSPALSDALTGFAKLRAGRCGVLDLVSSQASEGDALLGPSRAWRTSTPYRVNRHRRVGDARGSVELDVRAACVDSGLPTPVAVEISRVRRGPDHGVDADVVLRFAVEVSGPILLGRTCHRGGGVFEVLS